MITKEEIEKELDNCYEAKLFLASQGCGLEDSIDEDYYYNNGFIKALEFVLGGE